MKYFTIKELCASNTAKEQGINNEPHNTELLHLIVLIDEVLDPAREELGKPIKVNSGYRCQALNVAVAGASTSQHTKGQAADIVAVKGSNADLFRILLKQHNFDQLIWEKGNDKEPAWVHVSYKSPEENRHQVLRAFVEHGKTVYREM